MSKGKNGLLKLLLGCYIATQVFPHWVCCSVSAWELQCVGLHIIVIFLVIVHLTMYLTVFVYVTVYGMASQEPIHWSCPVSSGVRCKVTLLLSGKSGVYSLHVQVWRLLEVYTLCTCYVCVHRIHSGMGNADRTLSWGYRVLLLCPFVQNETILSAYHLGLSVWKNVII